MKADVCGIYVLEEIGSDRKYIGSTSCLQSRKRNQLGELKRGTNNSTKLQNAYDSGSRFVFKILLVCRKQDLKMYEQILLDSTNPELNVYKDADHKNLVGYKNPMYGKRRKDLSEYNKNRINPNLNKKMLKVAFANFVRWIPYWGA